MDVFNRNCIFDFYDLYAICIFFSFQAFTIFFANSFKAFLLGLNFDTRILCGIVLFPFLIGNLHLSYNNKKRLTIGSIAQLIFTIIIMVLLLIFMKKGHVPNSSLVYMGILFVLI